MLLSGGNLYRSVDRGINRMRTSYASSDGDNPDDDLLPSSAPTSSSSLLTMMMESPRAELVTSGGGGGGGGVVSIVSQLDALERNDHGSSSSSPSPQNGNCDRLHTEVVIAGGSRTHSNHHQHHHHHHHHQITTTTAATATCNAYAMPDDNLYSTSTTRKRKISKMWETVTYGASTVVDSGGAVAAAAAGGNLFGHSLYNVIGRQQNEHDNRQPQKELRKDSTTKMANWRAGDEIDTTSLAADFDDSLSGLGVELGTASYNMSEALQALPTLPTFKQEPDSETGCATTHVPSVTSQASTVNSSALSPHGNAGGATGSGTAGNSNSGSGAGGNSLLLPSVSSSAYQVTAVAAIAASNLSPTVVNQYRFQYVLGAATSIATKMHEETLTYLNQGQSYEIKLKKLGDLNDCRGKLLKSIVRVCFHERRLQYMEKEQIANWKQGRPGERILEIDIPLSYGICDIVQGVVMSNVCEFVWDPTKETGVFVRVNCISTEFTPKKHGGEKGVPFRVQIETLSHGDGNPQRFHSASCQIKVFKPKGADRKHKTDREKMEKRSGNEQEKYQPSYDCTVLRECTVDTVYSAPAAPGVGGGNGGGGGGVAVSPSMPQKSESVIFSSPSEQAPNTPTSLTADSPILDGVEALENSQTFDFMNMYQQPLPSDSSASQTTQWLQANRFGSYVRTFTSFSAADILRLSREDLIQICGLADGIRLFNSLHSRAIRPRLTLYVCTESEQVYHAIYLENLTVEEMLSKLSTLINFQLQNINRVYVQGPSGIHVFITDEVIQNIQDESMFTIESVKDRSGDCYLLLKVSSPR